MTIGISNMLFFFSLQINLHINSSTIKSREGGGITSKFTTDNMHLSHTWVTHFISLISLLSSHSFHTCFAHISFLMTSDEPHTIHSLKPINKLEIRPKGERKKPKVTLSNWTPTHLHRSKSYQRPCRASNWSSNGGQDLNLPTHSHSQKQRKW